ncbi:MAG: hypothetical protein ABIG93_04945 [archaeon]
MNQQKQRIKQAMDLVTNGSWPPSVDALVDHVSLVKPALTKAFDLVRDLSESQYEELTGRRAFQMTYQSAELLHEALDLGRRTPKMIVSPFNTEQCYRILDAAYRMLGGPEANSRYTLVRDGDQFKMKVKQCSVTKCVLRG